MSDFEVPIAFAVASAPPIIPAAFHGSIAGQNSTLDIPNAQKYLTAHDWPASLQQVLLKNLERLPIRFFILDDSGSMSTGDGHRLVGEGARKQLISCSRWAELGDSVRFHAGLAEASGAISEFRMLNRSVPITVGHRDENNGHSVKALLDLFEDSPSGKTPLCQHIRDVIQKIRGMEAWLRSTHQRAVVVIATDGESTDGDMAAAMKALEQLPVWTVVRLCTDEDSISNYWNDIDKVLELDLDILDDISGEAAEVHAVNRWLTYGEPLHRMREFGVTLKEMDRLDEQTLSSDEIVTVIAAVLGGPAEEYPNPQINPRGFMQMVIARNRAGGEVWNPITKRPAPWVNLSALRSFLPVSAHGGCCAIS